MPSLATALGLPFGGMPYTPSVTLFRDWVNFPTLNPVTGSAVGPSITFTRGSTGTYTDSTGTLQSAAIGGPRFDYDAVTRVCKGLLIEEQRTNLLTYSEQFDNAAWAKTNATIGTNSAASPDGAVSADSLIEAAASAAHNINSVSSVVSGTAYTFSTYIKSLTGNRWVMLLFGQTGAYCHFNPSTGTIGASSGTTATSMTNVGSGWYRVSISASASSTSSSDLTIRLKQTDNGSTTYTGDGTSGVLLWGAQLEAGSFATSYIPTTTATATRSADVLSVTGSNFTSFYNQTAGTLFASATSFLTSGSNSATYLEANAGSGSLTERIGVFKTAANPASIFTRLRTGGNTYDVAITATIATNVMAKVALAYSASSSNVSVNGVLGTGRSVALPTAAELYIGANINGWLSSIAYYPACLTDAQLQTLTS